MGVILAKSGEALEDLVKEAAVAIHSSSGLSGKVEEAAAKDDEKREEKRKDSGGAGALRRKPGLSPIPGASGGLVTTPWTVLHALARSLTLTRKGAARGLSEHWGGLKYGLDLSPDSAKARGHMVLSSDSQSMASAYYKRLRSDELGTGFGIVLAEHILRERYPGHMVSLIPADTALQAGWALSASDERHRKGRGSLPSRQQRLSCFFEVWKPGEPSRVFPVDFRGNHGTPARVHRQLADSSARVEAVHIGPWNRTPCMVFGTVLDTDRPITVYGLESPGSGRLLGPPSENLDRGVESRHEFPGINRPAPRGGPVENVPGFHIKPENGEWFQRVLAHTAVAGLAAFTGDGEAASGYLTEGQGKKYFSAYAHSATGSIRNVHGEEFFGLPFTGTDHVFRLGDKRLDAFSGVPEYLFDLVEGKKVEQYRREVHARMAEWSEKPVIWDERWGGPVSRHPDGSVLAIRPLHRST